MKKTITFLIFMALCSLFIFLCGCKESIDDSDIYKFPAKPDTRFEGKWVFSKSQINGINSTKDLTAEFSADLDTIFDSKNRVHSYNYNKAIFRSTFNNFQYNLVEKIDVEGEAQIDFNTIDIGTYVLEDSGGEGGSYWVFSRHIRLDYQFTNNNQTLILSNGANFEYFFNKK